MDRSTLSPPWYTLANMLAYTIGVSPYVKVTDLVTDGSTGYDLNIYVRNTDVAQAIRDIVPVSYDFGGVIVQTIVHDICKGKVVSLSNTVYDKAEEVANLFCTALVCNDLFVGSVLTEGKVNPTQQEIIGDVVIIIEKAVVQFYNDDISNLCNDFNDVAANVFSEVLIKEYLKDFKVSFTTYDSKCIKPKDLYCTN